MSRRPYRHRPIVAASLFVFLLLASPAGATTGTGIWKVVPTPNPGGSRVSDITFSAVSAASATDAWAVGIDQFGAYRHPLVERWDGSHWRAVRVPEPTDRQSWFNGVLDLSPTDAWAVGESTSPTADNQDQRTFVEHWDGTAWSIVPSPSPVVGGASGDVLQGIAGTGPADLWATGWVHDDPNNENVLLFEHFDGTAWKALPTPSPPGAEQFGAAITAVASDDVWAVGSNALQTTLAAHWNGRRWSIIPTPSLHDGISPLNALTGVSAVAANDVWASGYEGNVNNQNFMKPYVLHWDGAAWSLVLTPNLGGEGSRLNAATAPSATDVWAVGQTQELDGSILTLTERFDGTTWSVVPSPDPGSVGGLVVNSLSGVAGAGGGVLYAVGAQEISGQCCLRTLALRTNRG
jgi:hypothetical protein